MRKRPRRKQQQEPSPSTSEATNVEQASSAVCHSASTVFPSYLFPLFYLLLFAWIAVFTLNPNLSRYSGSYPWPITWLSGVHADLNDGAHEADRNDFALDTRLMVLPMNTSRLWKTSLRTHAVDLPISPQDLKCRPLLFKDVLFSTSFCACHPSPIDTKYKSRDSRDACKVLRFRSQGQPSSLSSSPPPPPSSSSSLSSLVNDTGLGEEHSSFESPESQEFGKEDVPLEGSRQLHVAGNGESLVPDILIKCNANEAVEDCIQLNADKQVEFGMHDHTKKHGGHQNSVSIDLNKNGEYEGSKDVENHTDISLPQSSLGVDVEKNGENHSSVYNHTGMAPHNNAIANESVSALVTSDILNKMHSYLTNLSRIHLRQEPGDGPYNYASDSKGAKVLASNKEAKGASNILNKDKDKYFRTPCNIEAKYVDMELSEETLVVEIIMANHEFYSSNVREFALWGSSIYPTDEWMLLGKFEAENSRVSQNFRLKEPQWVRYLKLQMLSHYGTDFYCTLSMVEVHGVDAIEWILEDWIAEELGGLGSQGSSPKDEDSSFVDKAPVAASPAQGQVLNEVKNTEEDIDFMLTQSLESTLTESSVVVAEGKVENLEKFQPVYHQTGRPGLDAVMKLLMHKVRTLEQKQPSLSRSLEELEARQRDVVGAHNNEVMMMMSKIDGIATEIANLSLLLQSMEGEWKKERHSLEEELHHQVKAWNADFESLRYELKSREDKGLVALAVSLFAVVFVMGMQVFMLCFSIFKPHKQRQTKLLPCGNILWSLPLLSCALVVCVLSL